MATSRAKTPKTISAFTARTHLGQLIKRVSEAGETFVLTKKGRPKAVILSVEEYQDLRGRRGAAGQSISEGSAGVSPPVQAWEG